MSKHAYLIMAHNEFDLLKKLIIMLDDPRNDIYLHVDKKAKDFDIAQFKDLTTKANLQIVERMKVSWGAYSQIQCELDLLKEATQAIHSYYHLLSGVDLPIKSQDEIHDFFIVYQGSEFIFYQHEAMSRKSFSERIDFYHPFQELIGSNKEESLLYQINRVLLKIQEIINLNRNKGSNTEFKKGTTWFSISHALACLVVSREPSIKRDYRFTQCADEIFLHTIAWNSEFRTRIKEESLRFIDWKRGRPYVFREDDFDLLINSDAFWARKFSEKVDPKIVEKVFTHVSQLSKPTTAQGNHVYG